MKNWQFAIIFFLLSYYLLLLYIDQVRYHMEILIRIGEQRKVQVKDFRKFEKVRRRSDWW